MENVVGLPRGGWVKTWPAAYPRPRTAKGHMQQGLVSCGGGWTPGQATSQALQPTPTVYGQGPRLHTAKAMLSEGVG